MSCSNFSQGFFAYSEQHLKHFVRSKNISLSSKTNITEKDDQSVECCLTDPNIDARTNYENIVGNKAFKEQKKITVKKKNCMGKEGSSKTVSESNQPFNFNLLMKASEMNNVSLVQELCKGDKKSFINFNDEFGWTPLMSACCAGAKDVVKLFLQWKPDITIRNKKGNTCWDLAKHQSHFCILQLLNDYTKNDFKHLDKIPVEKHVASNMKFYCEICKENVTDLSLSKHESSMMHLFNSSEKSKFPTIYGIPESNKGFQILLKAGWDKEKGLGPEGAGHKFPPKTILKQDKSGLGAREYKARVTHILNESDKIPKVKHSVRTSIKKEKRNEKRLERKLREMLN